MKELIIYGIGFIVVLIITFGLFGVFDNDEDNPFRNNK